MNRTGIAAAFNTIRGMVAIQTEDDGYTIIELLGAWHLEPGDEIAWRSGHAMGHQRYMNVTKGTSSEVFVQNHGVGPAALRDQLLLQ